ncbi:hypothetical protein [Pectinatus frisingensis]|uniref:hypothetical protein n=1 Tax=Pectinatus frisingensis TaxID=865 RepID=UPI0018C56739|nr:hypothetical protein [Pectinatus frisingensis]
MSNLTQKYSIIKGFLLVTQDDKVYVYEPAYGIADNCCNFKDNPHIFVDPLSAVNYILDLTKVLAEHKKAAQECNP